MGSFGAGFGEGFDVEAARPSVSISRLVLKQPFILKQPFKIDVPCRGTLLQSFTQTIICRGQPTILLLAKIPTVGSLEKPWSQKIGVRGDSINLMELYTWLTGLEEFEGEEFELLLLYYAIKNMGG